jgi:peptide/nickel transport system ATP-binding protein
MILDVADLSVDYRTPRGALRAVDRVDLSLTQGTLLGLVGESGCGKSTLVRAVMGVLPPAARIAGGAVRLNGTDLVSLPPGERRARLWREIAFVPQTAMNALDPVWRLRAQMHEVLRGRGGFRRAEADARAEAGFRAVGLDPARLDDFPHQFSGGMRQRAGIALALALDPPLVLLDEPVTALDVIVQRQVLDTLRELVTARGLTAILVTHDISVVAYVCSEIAVMYAGRIVERGSSSDVLESPAHPYTMGLMNAFPDIGEAGEGHADQPGVLLSIPGSPPRLDAPPPGCRFAPRCPFAEPRCHEREPERLPISDGRPTSSHSAACHRIAEAATLRDLARDPATWNG